MISFNQILLHSFTKLAQVSMNWHVMSLLGDNCVAFIWLTLYPLKELLVSVGTLCQLVVGYESAINWNDDTNGKNEGQVLRLGWQWMMGSLLLDIDQISTGSMHTYLHQKFLWRYMCSILFSLVSWVYLITWSSKWPNLNHKRKPFELWQRNDLLWLLTTFFQKWQTSILDKDYFKEALKTMP